MTANSDTPKTLAEQLSFCHAELQRSFAREEKAQVELVKREARRDPRGIARSPTAQAAWDMLRFELRAANERVKNLEMHLAFSLSRSHLPYCICAGCKSARAVRRVKI